MPSRTLLLLALLCTICTHHALAQIALVGSYDQPPSPAAQGAMAAELNALFAPAGLELALYQDSLSNSTASPQGVLFVHFTGAFRPAAAPAAKPANASLAHVTRVDGQMLPLVTVDSNAIALYIRPAMTAADLKQADALYGRAAARVIAHEIYHWLTGQPRHERSKLFAERISVKTLLAPATRFEPREVELLRVNR